MRYKGQEKNRGMSTVEVTLLMPWVLLIFILGITLLLGGLKQGLVHSRMMTEVRRSNCPEQSLPLVGSWISDEIEESEEVTFGIAFGYELGSEECFILRHADKENDLRRLDVYGSAIQERWISPVSDLEEE